MADQIRMVGEDQAQGQLATVFHDIKQSMGVPFVGDMFRAFAAYPLFLELVWSEIKPVVGTAAFDGLADRIRAHAIASARQCHAVGDLAEVLERRGVDKAEIARLRDTLEVFYQTNPRLLVIATAIRESLLGGPVGHDAASAVTTRRVPAPSLSMARLMREGQTPEGARQVLDEAKAILDVPFIPADLTALARRPDDLRLVWDDIKGQFRSAQFCRNVEAIERIAVAGVAELPGVVRLEETALKAAGLRQEQVNRVSETAALFQRFYPNMVGMVAVLRLGMNGALEDRLLEMEAGA